jgi:hypothetical protein
MSERETCKTCRFWGKVSGIKWMAELPMEHARGYCEGSGVIYNYAASHDEIAASLIQVESDEGWGMTTRQDFGCVLHKPLEVAKT